MKFIVDAQLPYRLALILKDKGIDAIHTDDLPDKERTTDEQISSIATSENRIVITKDSDFLDSYLIRNIPAKLLIVTTGNIKNRQLFELLQNNWILITHLFETCNLVELNNNYVTGQ
jgi:predicted nuclease of predicted toxin-antitoxin system